MPADSSRRISPDLITYHRPDHPISKQYAALLEQMLLGLTPGPAPVLLLTGSAPRVGTTTVLLNLAVCAAGANRRIVAVDANYHQPDLASLLGLEDQPGWMNVLAGNLALEQAVQQTSLRNLQVLPGDPTGETQGIALAPDAVRWVLRWLRERFDIVLVDGPDLKHGSDLAVLAPACDGLYLVVPQSEASLAQDRTLVQNLPRLGGRLRGLVHTHVEM